MSWLSVFCSIAADELADRGGDADRTDDEHDERACDEFGAQREPVETVEEEFGEGLVPGFECGGFRRGACGAARNKGGRHLQHAGRRRRTAEAA